MKEIEIKAIEAILKKEINEVNIKYLIVFIVLNLIIAFTNWLIQRNIKNIENTIYKKQVREDKRITVIEYIYQQLVSFTYILDENEMKTSISKLSELEKYISNNKLYIDNSLFKTLISYSDYVKTIMVDFRLKDYSKEKKLLSAIEKEFNK